MSAFDTAHGMHAVLIVTLLACTVIVCFFTQRCLKGKHTHAPPTGGGFSAAPSDPSTARDLQLQSPPLHPGFRCAAPLP